MKEIVLQNRAVIEETKNQVSEIDKKRLRRWTVALYLSVIAGIVFAVGGLVLGAFSYLGLSADAESVNQIGNLIIIAAFPLMMLGAHALDKINEIKTDKKRL